MCDDSLSRKQRTKALFPSNDYLRDGAVTTKDFHNMIIIAKRDFLNNVIAISIGLAISEITSEFLCFLVCYHICTKI